MDKELKKQVAAVVADLFNEKEEADIRSRTEAELQRSAESISELTSALEDKNAEVAAVEEKISENETRIQELESELEAAKTELETASTKLTETEQALEDMKKDRAAEVRMTELEDAGVARSDRDSQMSKVREMTEEEFASYKDELVSIREAVLSELEEARKQAEADAKAEEEAAKQAAEEDNSKKESEAATEEASEESNEEEASEESAEENASEESEETTAPAEITPGQAAMASLNLEYIPSNDLVSKYADLGKAMAARWAKSEE
jgi:chromosome segregation ATPase